jgi:hypothetical protein
MGPGGFRTNHGEKRMCKMTRSELQLRVENLEELLDEILTLLDDPNIVDGELRDQLRALLEEDNDDQ